MKVKQLIAELKKYDPDTKVVIKGYEGGYDDITKVATIRLRLNANNTKWYYGKHEQDDNGDTDALVIC